MLTALISIGIFFLMLGVGYPLMAILIYPIYRVITGDKDFRKYLRDL